MRVIFENEQLGIMDPRDANRIAKEKGLDLVEIAPTARPPVCRIMDYGRYLYEEKKKKQEARKKQKQVVIKEIKLRVRIDNHDFEVKRKRAERFLKDGCKVKFTIWFRGREVVHAELGAELLERMMEEIGELGVVEKEPVLERNNMTMMVAPKK